MEIVVHLPFSSQMYAAVAVQVTKNISLQQNTSINTEIM